MERFSQVVCIYKASEIFYMKKNILILSPVLDYVLASKILQEHYSLDRAGSCEEVLQMLEKKEYCLFLFDANALKPDYTFLNSFSDKEISLVALASEPEDARDSRLKKLGCPACYVKPFRQDSFLMFIQYWAKPVR